MLYLKEYTECVHQISQEQTDLRFISLQLTTNLFLFHSSSSCLPLLFDSLNSLFLSPTPPLFPPFLTLLSHVTHLLSSFASPLSSASLTSLFSSLTSFSSSSLPPFFLSSLHTSISFFLQHLFSTHHVLTASFLFSSSLFSLLDDYFLVVDSALSHTPSIPPPILLLLLFTHTITHHPTTLFQHASLPIPPDCSSLSSFASFLPTVPIASQKEFQDLLKQYVQNVFDFWNAMMKHKEYSSLQRQVLSMEWIVVILKNSSLFLEPTVLKAILESFFPMLPLDWSEDFVDFSGIFFLPLIDRFQGYFEYHHHVLLRNCRKAFFFSVLKDTEIPTILVFFRVLSKPFRLSLLSLLGLISAFENDGVVHFLKAFLECGVAEKTALSVKSEEVLKDATATSLSDEELSVVTHVVIQVCVNGLCHLSRLSSDGAAKLAECAGFLLELTESIALLSDSPLHCDAEAEGVLRDCVAWVKGQEEAKERVVGYCKEHSLRVGNGGVVDFCGQRCVLSLGDLPASFYPRVNEYLLQFASLCRVCNKHSKMTANRPGATRPSAPRSHSHVTPPSRPRRSPSHSARPAHTRPYTASS